MQCQHCETQVTSHRKILAVFCISKVRKKPFAPGLCVIRALGQLRNKDVLLAPTTPQLFLILGIFFPLLHLVTALR